MINQLKQEIKDLKSDMGIAEGIFEPVSMSVLKEAINLREAKIEKCMQEICELENLIASLRDKLTKPWCEEEEQNETLFTIMCRELDLKQLKQKYYGNQN
ncbi:hypothetical protein [Elizabethkingia phage TCUEAP1]|nr:hypothetical protein [Elizabethkingia phage TCUEAP1]